MESFYLKNQTCTAHVVQFYTTEPSLVDIGSQYFTSDIDKRDCAQILDNDPTSKDGVYIINPFDGKGPFEVYCDMTTDGGGWTVFQRRQDNTTDFFRNWTSYKDGFGGLEGNFWLGNEIIHRLTNERPSQLRIDMLDHTNQSGYATYTTFLVDGEPSSYKVHVSGFTGNRGDSFTYAHNGMIFSTVDKAMNSCPKYYFGGWWYGVCHNSNLNGLYYPTEHLGTGMVWSTWHGYYVSLKRTEMKLKPSGM